MVENAHQFSIPIEVVGFLTGMMGLGGFLGFFSGYATKKIAKLFAVIIGVIFIIMQILTFKGFITINWDGIINSTGKYFEREYIQSSLDYFLNILTVNLPFAGSYIVGFWIGIKKG